MNSEIFKGNEAGFFASDNKEWYEGLRYLYLNENEGNKMGKYGYQIVKERYSLDLISDKIADIFSKYTAL
jgi:glycosyltransferase involved in cell wall biosynthesis